TRRKALVNLLEETRPGFNHLREQVEILYFDFDEDLRPVEALKEEAAEGKQSAIGVALDAILRESQQARVSGVFFLSDFAQRTLPGKDIDPRTAARRLADRQIPIHTFPLGASGLTATALDVAVEDLQVDPFAFEKTTVPVTVRIPTVGA